MRTKTSELGELERAVMRILWSGNALSAEAVREKLDRGLKEATVRTVLRRLEDKGYVAHRIESRTFIYTAAEPRQRAAARAVKRIVDWFCDGSVDEVLVGLVDARMLDAEQIDRLAARVQEMKAQDKTRGSQRRKGARR